MLVKVTHPDSNYELLIDLREVVIMERYNHPKSIIITQNSDKPSVTALVLRNGKTIACKETPDELMALMNAGA